jgi:hypothetical protein
VKVFALVAVPAGVVTLMWPLVAPAGTVATMNPEASTVNAAWVPLKLTTVAFTNAEPRMVIFAPTAAPDGEKPAMAGGCGASPEVKRSIPGLERFARYARPRNSA